MEKNAYTQYFLKQHPDKVRIAVGIVNTLRDMSVEDLELSIRLHGNRETKKMLHEILAWRVKQI
jgi:hypothetical protein